MLNIRNIHLVVAAFLLAAGCATAPYGEFKPKGELGPSNPSAYDTYGKAMASVEGYKMAYEWQMENPKLVEDATKVEVLAKFVESPAAADELLSKIGSSYTGDPIALTQIAAVTQLVMSPKCSKCPKSANCRAVWVAALERARKATDDGYVKTFCDQQLRFCK